MQWYSAFGKDIESALSDLKGKTSNRPKGLIAFLMPEIDPEAARSSLMRAFPALPLIGCSATGTFTDEAVSGAAVSLAVVMGEDVEMRTGITDGQGIDPVFGLEAILSQIQSKEAPSLPTSAALLLADGFFTKGSDLALSASGIFGVPVAGGLAGDILSQPKTTIFTEDGSTNSAFAVALLHTPSKPSIGIEHGHTPISPPLVVTRVSGSTVFEISHKPAIRAWKDLDLLSESLSKEEQRQALIRYELGIQVGTRYIVRYPAKINPDGSISFLTEIPEHSPCRILDARKDKQIEAAGKSAGMALQALGAEPSGALVFDCAVRFVSLKEDFRLAVERIRDTLHVPFAGFETSGEIAMLPEDAEGFHNTTTVTLAFP